MVVLCIGMQRSASTWSFNVCRALLERLPETFYGGFHAEIEEISGDTTSKAHNFVIKSHGTSPLANQLLLTGEAYAVYSHRDVHDSIVSQMSMFGVDFDEALDQIRQSLMMVDQYCDLANFFEVSYDEIVGQPERVVRRLAKFLRINVSRNAVETIVRTTSFAAMKKAADQLQRDVPLAPASHPYDTKTLLHPSHIRNGSCGYGYEYLDPAERAAVAKMLKSLPANAFGLATESIHPLVAVSL